MLPGLSAFGDWRCPLFPKASAKYHTFVGKAMAFPKIESPTDADVRKYHKMYVDELKTVFDENKVAAGYPEAQLEIW